MGKFEREILPKGLITAQAKQKALQHELSDIGRQLDYDDEFGDHECDCDRRESNDRDGKRLDWQEREELQAKYDALEPELVEIDQEIKRLIRYQQYVEKAGIA